MFSDNEKISSRQIYRGMVVTLAGPTLLIGPLVAGKYGKAGILVYFVAGVIILLYTKLMLCMGKKKMFCPERGKNYTKKYLAASVFFRLVLALRMFALAILSLYLICDVVKDILLPNTHQYMILLAVAIILIYWNRGSMESTARAFEVIFYWVLIPVVIVMGVAMTKVESENIIPDAGITGIAVENIIKDGIWLWIVFCPAELLVLCRRHYKEDAKTSVCVWRGITMLAVLNVITYFTILGIYGENGLEKGGTYPLLKVMQISGIPGDFLRRVDGFMSVFLILSLFCGMVMMMDYLGISMWQMGQIMFGSENKKSSKKKLVYSIVITGAMVASVILIHKAVGKFENEPEKQEIISAVQLEDRGFVMSVIIGEQTVVFEIASDQDKAWRDESRYVKLDTGLIEEAEKLYRENGEKKLDFSHMKVVFIQKEIYDGPVSYENLKYMYEEERFAKNILVCPLEKDLKDMAADAMEEGTAFAVKIENIMVNSDKSKTHELYKVYQSMEDKS